jgi:hypothetical protein
LAACLNAWVISGSTKWHQTMRPISREVLKLGGLVGLGVERVNFRSHLGLARLGIVGPICWGQPVDKTEGNTHCKDHFHDSHPAISATAAAAASKNRFITTSPPNP